MNPNKIFSKKVRITGTLIFDTAFHIGSGREGELATDMGVLREADGRPILPGSTLKGNFRSYAERLSSFLDMEACLMDSGLSGKLCVSDEKYRKQVYDDFKDLENEARKLEWLGTHCCHVCRFFGSPLEASRIFFSDGKLTKWSESLQVRDGVCIDRDTETARYGAKYDFEVVPEGAEFQITIELENPSDKELALTGAVIAEWENGFRLGGFTSRGLGKVRLTETKTEEVDYKNPEQLKSYLLHRKMTPADNLLSEKLERVLGGGNA
jgi:CRISPR-associated RAMP protein (TIGR02581 family)